MLIIDIDIDLRATLYFTNRSLFMGKFFPFLVKSRKLNSPQSVIKGREVSNYGFPILSQKFPRTNAKLKITETKVVKVKHQIRDKFTIKSLQIQPQTIIQPSILSAMLEVALTILIITLIYYINFKLIQL